MKEHEERISTDLRTPESLAFYIAPDDNELTRKEFLFTVATRILDDLGIPHELDGVNPNLWPDMTKWSDERLDRELAFAKPADDGGTECAAWNAALEKERARRG